MVSAIAVLLFAGREGSAIINPRFTPVELARQAETIALVTAAPGKDADSWALAATEAIKGKPLGAGTLKLAPAKPESLDEIRKLVKLNGREPMLLFAAEKDRKQSAYLSVNGTWLAAESADSKTWTVTGLLLSLSGTWAGGTDQLARCVRWCLAEPAADVPAGVGASWMETPCVLAKIDGKITGLATVDLPGQKDRFLFVASPAGNRLFRAKTGAEAFEDATAAMKLASRSTQFAWAGGRLLSWDGKALQLYEFRADGTFAPAAGVEPFALDECLGLAPMGSASFLVSTRGTPFVLSLKGNAWEKTPLEGLASEDREPKFVSAGLVADFTGDGLPDVLEPRATCGILWKGTPGGFERAVPVMVFSPDPAATAAVADFNNDGALDVFLAGPKFVRLFENDGKGNFTDVTGGSGSFSYKAGSGASACLATDLNHDGRTDLALLHADGEFTYHFNRGFRCFGEEGELRLPVLEPGKGDMGQTAAAAADFNGDGSLDFAVAFADGNVACFYNDAFSRPILRVAVKAGLPVPVTVSVWQGEKSPLCFSALSVGPARVDFTLHHLDPRQCVVKWRRADGTVRSLTVTIPEPLPDGGLEVTVGD